jgi:hypothetical protein
LSRTWRRPASPSSLCTNSGTPSPRSCSTSGTSPGGRLRGDGARRHSLHLQDLRAPRRERPGGCHAASKRPTERLRGGLGIGEKSLSNAEIGMPTVFLLPDKEEVPGSSPGRPTSKKPVLMGQTRNQGERTEAIPAFPDTNAASPRSARRPWGERYLHGTSCMTAHTRHDVGVGVQGYRYCGVSQELLDVLRMSSFALELGVLRRFLHDSL